MGANPSKSKGWGRPVERVSWDDVQAFLAATLAALGLRLPSEAEWEYAGRAGSTAPRYGELDAIAWFDKNAGRETHPVMQKRPNAWGLYDTLGNVSGLPEVEPSPAPAEPVSPAERGREGAGRARDVSC